MKLTEDIDVTRMSRGDRQHIMESIVRDTEEGNALFLSTLRGRLDRAGIDLPKIEVRYEHLNVDADVNLGSGSPSLLTFVRAIAEWPFQKLGATQKTKLNILKDVSGVLKPRRLTLLLGPPQSGRSTFLQALAGRLRSDVQVSGEITYNGHRMHEFVPRKTSAYVSQYDVQTADLTVREDLDFYSRVQGVGHRHEMVTELTKREREAGIEPDADVDVYLKATSLTGQSSSLVTDYVMKLMGLDSCADTLVGDAMRRGISGGQMKRVTTAEMLVGPAKALFMDQKSTGLDSSTMFQITKMLGEIAHLMDSTIVVSLLQPPPETYALFDDLILLADRQIVYQGPCIHVLEFMARMGFRCPGRKAPADFLQEVTSRKDQRQYWADTSVPYENMAVSRFVEGFESFHVGQDVQKELSVSYDKTRSHPAALVHDKYALGNWELLKACFRRESILMKRNRETYASKVLQIGAIALVAATLFIRTSLHHDTMNDATVYMGGLFFGLVFITISGLSELSLTMARLPVYFKEKELFLYPAWALAIPVFLLRTPWTILETGVYLVTVYFVTGFAPEPGRFFRLFLVLFLVNQAILAIYRFAGKTRVIGAMVGSAFSVVTILLGGFVLSRNDIPVWWKWASWGSVLQYGQEAVSLNEFLSKEWDKPYGGTTLGISALQHRGLQTRGYWVWLSIGALRGFVILFNTLMTLSLQYLETPLIGRSSAVNSNMIAERVSPKDSQRPSVRQDGLQRSATQTGSMGAVGLAPVPARSSGCSNVNEHEKLANATLSTQSVGRPRSSGLDDDGTAQGPKGMALPFIPLTITFDKINYYVDVPETACRMETVWRSVFQNWRSAFQKFVWTLSLNILGKTTLLDVLAGRKTRGYEEGQVLISGYPKRQATFARIAGYCEQNDIHSPNITVFESLVYSAWMRLSPDVDTRTRTMFMNEVTTLVELDDLRDVVVGLRGVSGLSTEQRKRQTIAVELVANPSIIFLDEPTSGLDARAAAIVMRAVRNIADTGRNIVCTIHQPSIEIFEAFDEAIPGVSKIKEGQNPATWMLEVSSTAMESKLGADFGQLFAESAAYQANQALIEELSIPAPDSQDLAFPTVYAQPFSVRCAACFWKISMSYWRNTDYSAIKLVFTAGMAVLTGSIFWGVGKKRETQQDVFNLMGVLYTSVLFIGANGTMAILPIITVERIVYYRERGAGMYSPLTYALAQFLIEWPYVFCQSVLFTSIVYPMMQFQMHYAKILWFLFLLFFTLLFYVYWGMVAAAVTPTPQLASIVATSVFGLFNLFAGFTITKKQMPVWWRWFYWCTPTAWTLDGLVSSQLADVNTLIYIPDQVGQRVTVKEYLESYFGFQHSFLKFVAAEQIGLVMVMAVVFATSIKYCNYQRR